MNRKSYLNRVIGALLSVCVAAVFCTPTAFAKSIPSLNPEMTVMSSHEILYGDEGSLTDGKYGAATVDGGNWIYVQTNSDGTNNHVSLTVDMHGLQTVYRSSIGTVVEGWADKMENLVLSASLDGTSYTEVVTFDNAALAPLGVHRPEWVSPEGAPIMAQYLKYEFDISSATPADSKQYYVCLDEIDVQTSANGPQKPPVTDPDKGDSINLAAGKAYLTTWEASSNYPDSSNELTDGVYSRTLSSKAPEWVGYYNNVDDGFDFIVDLAEKKSFEQIKMNFLREEASGIPTPKSVRIELSDNNSDWRVFATTDISPIEEGIGIKRFVYTVPEGKRADASARYVKLHVNFSIWMFIDEIEIFDKKTPDEGTDIPPDELPAINLASGLSLKSTRELLYGAPATILTDNVRANGAWNDSTWLSFNGSDSAAADKNVVYLTYDLGGKKSISDIRLNALYDSNNGVFLPKHLQLEVSDNGTKWTMLKSFGPAPFNTGNPGSGEYTWNGKQDAFISTTENADMVYSQYVRIKFDCSGAWSSFDELEIIGKDGKTTTAGTLIGTPDGPQNLALNKPYTVSHKAPSAYKDTDDKELTDASLGSADMYDPAWQGHSGEWPIRTIIVDLGTLYAVEQVGMNFLEKASATVRLPSKFTVYSSNDGKTWAELYSSKPESSGDGVYIAQWKSGASDSGNVINVPVAAQYIRVDAELNGWLFFDEIEIYGKPEAGGALSPEQNANFEGAFKEYGPDTGNMQDMVLMYNGAHKDYDGNKGYGSWSKDDSKPYVAYVDEKGKALDTMFDGALFLAQFAADTDHAFIESSDYGAVPSDLADWKSYLEKTIGKNGDMAALNEAVRETAGELNRPDLKMKVSIMVPFPDPLRTDFGTLNGEALNLSKTADAQKALDWYLAEVLRQFGEAGFDYLELTSFYWMHETNYRSDLIQYASRKAMSLGKPMTWIPFYNANGWNRGEEMELSAVALQPNHFFPADGPSGKRIADAATLAKMYGLGMELEMDDRVFIDLVKYNKYLDYLNGGIDHGYLGTGSGNKVYRNWYNGIKTLLEASKGINPYTRNADPVARSVYDFTYQAIKGKYTKQEYRTSLEPGPQPQPEPKPDPKPSDPVWSPTVPEPAVNKTELNTIISVAEKKNQSDYTAESWSVFVKILKEANVIKADPNATQSAIMMKQGALKEAMEALILKTSESTSKPAPILTDILGHWAESNIQQLIDTGIIHGYPDSTFMPEQAITRSEFVTTLVRILKLETKQVDVSFTDISTHWAKGGILTAIAHNLIAGYDETTFGPDDKLTREQMAVMLVNAAKLAKVNTSTTYSDQADVSTWATSSISAVTESNLMRGYPNGSFKPKKVATRAEAAQVLITLLALKI